MFASHELGGKIFNYSYDLASSVSSVRQKKTYFLCRSIIYVRMLLKLYGQL